MVSVYDLLGVPFVDGGRNVKTGLDCWGLYMEIMRRFGVTVPDFKISCFAADLINHEKINVTQKLMIKVDAPEPGDGIAMAIHPEAPDMVQHFGVMVDKRKFCHTLEKTGVLLTKTNDGYWKDKIRGFYRWVK